MPNRILRDGILTSERINALVPHAELFYRRLMSVVDDFGRFSANPTLLRAACYPLKLDGVKEESIRQSLKACEGSGLIVLYTDTSGKALLEMQDFRQQVRAKVSKYPAPDSCMRSTCVADATQQMDATPSEMASLSGEIAQATDIPTVSEKCVAHATHMLRTCVAHAHLDVDVDVDQDQEQKQEQEQDQQQGKSSISPGARASREPPSWLPATAWADWHRFRNSRKGWTVRAQELSLRTLVKLHALGHDPTAVIEQSIERGWTGLFPLKSEDYHANIPATKQRSSVVGRVEQAIRESRARRSADDSDDPLAAFGYGRTLDEDGGPVRALMG